MVIRKHLMDIFGDMETRTNKKRYRIRRLTPTECLRLMKVSDEDIAKMKGAGISDSQLYKMAGNSIVVQVLEGIFRNMDFEEKPLKVFEAFAGYGSQSMALRNIGVDHEVVGISEIDKYAIKAYNATHPETTNYGDISRIDWGIVPDFDLFTYSFPCTDISNAGAQAGFEEGSGTRSSLLWECRKAIEEKHPKYLLMENVKAITSKKFLPGLLRWQEFLSKHGYVNFIEVLNAKDYGIPQNRERCFLVSILDAGWYQFPEPVELKVKLKDILEKKVDEKYYLDQKRVDDFIAGLSDEKREKLEGGCTV
jgi:DNA-cytosine methyltransferase